MQISVALDGAKRRDIRMYQGDTQQFDLVVYRKDGDEVPIDSSLITDARMHSCGPYDGVLPIGSSFVVHNDMRVRNWFTLTALVEGVRTTLAFGWLLGYGFEDHPYPWGNDYGWRWPYGPGNWGVAPW